MTAKNFSPCQPAQNAQADMGRYFWFDTNAFAPPPLYARTWLTPKLPPFEEPLQIPLGQI